MSSTQQSIVTQGKVIAAATLGSTWRALRYIYQPERNDGRDSEKGYAVAPDLAGFDETGVLGYETLNHEFLLLLSDVVARYDSDDDVQTILNTLYDKGDQVFKQFVTLRMNLPASVLKVDSRSIEAPVIANGAVYLRMRFVVKYRQSLL